MNILVAEDEKDIRQLIELHLSKEGHNVIEAENGIEAIKAFESNKIDLAIFDVMMPLLDGFTALKKIRETSTIPVIFLTARGEDTDKVLGLGLGADDYMVKPFSPLELTARVQAHLRRSHKYKTDTISNKVQVGNLILDKESCILIKNEVDIELNSKEYKILVFLMENSGKVFTKKQLYENVWEEMYYGDDNTIMVYISRIRDKIEDEPRNPIYLKTIRGIGYKFESDRIFK